MENNTNILSPVVDCLCDVVTLSCKGLYSMILKSMGKESDFDFNSYFESVNLFTKNEKGVIIKPKKIKKEETVKGIKYTFTIPPGYGVESLNKFKDGIESALGEKVEFDYFSKYWTIEVLKNKIPNKVEYTLPTKDKDLMIPIGLGLNGVVYLNLRVNPNAYIVGTTGSGKSVCLKSILTSLVNLYSPKELELILCDLKRVELSQFKDLEHCTKFVYTVEDTTNTIFEILEECNRRYELFEKRGVPNIWEYNQLVKDKLNYKILVIEEVVLMLQDRKGEGMKYIKQLCAICRACGIQVILTMQRPSNDILDSVAKSCITNRICFKCEDLKNSIIALDDEGCEKLKGMGHGILKVGANKTEFQGYNITTEQVQEYTKEYKRKEELKTTSKQIGFDESKNENFTQYQDVVEKYDLDIDLDFLDKL